MLVETGKKCPRRKHCLFPSPFSILRMRR
jgi:hypothetical protein